MGERLSTGLQHLSRCPFCHDGVETEDSVACQGCLARHHAGCWDEHGACASCGERTALAPREAARAAGARQNPLDEQPVPLANSRVRVERTEDGIRLSYPGPRAALGNRPDGFALLFGVLLAFAAAVLAPIVAGNVAPGGSVVPYVLMAIILAPAPFIALALWGLRGRRRERLNPPLTHLDLSADGLRLDRPHGWRQTRLEPLEVGKADVGNVQSLNGHLFVDFGAKRVSIASAYPIFSPAQSGPELEWLRGVMTRWRNTDVQGDPSKKGS